MHYKEYKRILGSRNNMNIYRGCSHGCIYCDSRSICYQINHNFEDIEVKTNAPTQLEDEIRRKRKKIKEERKEGGKEEKEGGGT